MSGGKLAIILPLLWLGMAGCSGKTSSSSASPSPSPSPSPSSSPTPSPLFSASNPWTGNISADSVDSASANTISWLGTKADCSGANCVTFYFDTSLVLLNADATTPLVPFVQASGYYSPDCDTFPLLPLPTGGVIEGSTGYNCTSGDCLLLINDAPTGTLFELWNATSQNGGIVATCGVHWDLGYTYPANLRGDGCTSADAAGFPISAMLPSPDEVAAGSINHALRVVLPDALIRKGYYAHPATHYGAPSATNTSAAIYGTRFRLRADYPISSLPSGAAQVIAVALQKYGMFLADGNASGVATISLESDQFTTNKWSSLGFAANMFAGVRFEDFEIVELTGKPRAPTQPLSTV